MWSNSIIFISSRCFNKFFDLISPDCDLFIKSIWDGSPFTTSFEFSPILVKNILICVSVAFCASSRIAKLFFKVLPLINANGAISISPDSIFLSIFSAPKSSYSASYKGLRYGSTFSLMSPGKKPNLSPASTAGLDKIIRSIFFSNSIVSATATDKNVQQAIAGLLTSSGLGVDNDELLARTQGNIVNNNLELLFKGPTLRPFTFQFNLSPRDSGEARQVQKIIRAFKQSSSVQKTTGGIFLAAPNTYKLEFISGKTNKTHAFLPRIKECALLGVNMNYMPENSYMTYDDTSMVAYNMQLAFQELEPIFNDDYDNNDTEDSGLVSTAASPFTGSIGF